MGVVEASKTPSFHTFGTLLQGICAEWKHGSILGTFFYFRKNIIKRGEGFYLHKPHYLHTYSEGF